jgi:hypothetical protein
MQLIKWQLCSQKWYSIFFYVTMTMFVIVFFSQDTGSVLGHRMVAAVAEGTDSTPSAGAAAPGLVAPTAAVLR